MTAQRPALMTNPRTDTAFRAHAESLVASGIGDPKDLEARLRDRYPAAVVRARLLTGERVSVWYVYREGRWIPAESEHDRSAREEDFRTTGENAALDAARIQEIESEKVALGPDDPRTGPLAREAERIVDRLRATVRIERAMTDGDDDADEPAGP